MSQYRNGLVALVNSSAAVVGTDTAWTTEVEAGDLFVVTGEDGIYEVASVTDNTNLSLTAPYGGTTRIEVDYSISRDFTPHNNLPYPQRGDIEVANLLKRTLINIDSLIGNAPETPATPEDSETPETPVVSALPHITGFMPGLSNAHGVDIKIPIYIASEAIVIPAHFAGAHFYAGIAPVSTVSFGLSINNGENIETASFATNGNVGTISQIITASNNMAVGDILNLYIPTNVGENISNLAWNIPVSKS